MGDYDNEKRNLEHWSHRISHALQILDLEEENELILKLAEESSRSVCPSAGAISSFYVGYAAALAATSGHVDPQTAVRSAVEKALKLCTAGNEQGPDQGGWAATAQ